MERRIVFLESKLSDCLESLEAVNNNVTAIKQFLEKTYGSRFLDSVMKCSTKTIEKKFTPPNRNTNNFLKSRNFQAQNSQLAQKRKANTSTADFALDNYYGKEEEDEEEEEEEVEEETMEVQSDPLEYLEIVDDREDERQDDMNYEDNFEIENVNNEELNESYFELGESESEEAEADPAGLVIIDYRTQEELTNGTSKSGSSQMQNKSFQSSTIPYLPGVTKKRTASIVPRFLGKQPALKKPALEVQQPEVIVPSYNDESNGNDDEDSLPPSIRDILEDEIGDPNSLMIEDPNITINEIEGPMTGENLRDCYDILPDRSVQCRICQKVLKAGWHKYPRHYRTHTGEKPFACEFCGERFARKDNMHNHVKSKHHKIKREPARSGPSSRSSSTNNHDNEMYEPAYLPPGLDVLLE